MSNQMLDVIDYGGGNLGSVCRALERLALPYELATPERLPDGSRPIILPGVGAFSAVMTQLNQGGFTPVLKSLLADGVPFLGICVGLQVLFESSEESPGISGLGLLPGQVKRFHAQKVPQIGWNTIRPHHTQDTLKTGAVYFVNSYYAAPENPCDILFNAEYENDVFCAAVRHQNITAYQFHPEKSGRFGHELLQDWAKEAS